MQNVYSFNVSCFSFFWKKAWRVILHWAANVWLIGQVFMFNVYQLWNSSVGSQPKSIAETFFPSKFCIKWFHCEKPQLKRQPCLNLVIGNIVNKWTYLKALYNVHGLLFEWYLTCASLQYISLFILSTNSLRHLKVKHHFVTYVNVRTVNFCQENALLMNG